MRNGNWMQTFTGRAYYPTDPHPDDVCIEDIAHALSQECRFGGHCREFYSVAEHSYWVSYMVHPEYALEGLLHDAAEAYMKDIPRPLKHSSEMAEYRRLEKLNRRAICYRLGIDFHEPREVKQADNDILLVEHKALFGTPPLPWMVPGASTADSGIKICGYTPKLAEAHFLGRYFTLTGKEVRG